MTNDDPDFPQRAVLEFLLSTHPAMQTIEEVERVLNDVPDLDTAVAQLVGDGLVNRLGNMLGASRAAVRADQLSL